MGLDMWIFKKEKTDKIGENGKPCYELKELCYLRKANQIRNWFESNLDEFASNGETPLTKDILQNLLDDCKKVIANHELADELLPTRCGFFFGSTEYDEWYYNQVEGTIKKLETIINEVNWEVDEIVYDEWW